MALFIWKEKRGKGSVDLGHSLPGRVLEPFQGMGARETLTPTPASESHINHTINTGKNQKLLVWKQD